MTSGNSLWVRTKENARRRRWLWIGNCFVFFMWMPIRFLAMCSSLQRDYGTNAGDIFIDSARNLLMSNIGFGNVSSLTSYSVMYSSFTTLLLIMLSAVIAAMEGYSYLYDRRKVDRFHSEPVSCRIRFFSIYLNGFKNFALPYLCSVLLSVLIGGYYHLLTGKMIGYFVGITVFTMLFFLAVYHMAILAVVLTGNYIAGVCGILAFLGIEWAIRSLVYRYCLAYYHTFSSYSRDEIMSPVFSVATIFLQGLRKFAVNGEKTVTALLRQMGSSVGGMLLLVVIALALAYLAYRNRPAEAAGHSMAFGFLKPLVKITAMVLAGLTLGWILSDLSGKSNYIVGIGFFMGVLLAHCIVGIILEQRLSAVFHNLWQLGLGIVISGLIFSVFAFDLTRFDDRVPKAADIDTVAIALSAQQNDSSSYYGDFIKVMVKRMYLKDTEAALQFAAADYFHQTGDNELLDYNNQYDVTTVLYRMKNGKEYYRTYYIDMAAQSDMMDRLLENEDYKKAVFRIYDEDYMVGYDRKQCYFEDVFGTKTLREEEIADLIECLKQDYTSYSYTNLRDEVEIGQISFNASDKNYIDQMSDSYAVYPFCKKTLAYLEQKGYYESGRTLLDEVKRVEITYYVDDDYMNVKTENYDDRAEIEEIISSCQLSNFGTWWKEQNDYISDVYVSTYTSDGNIQSFRVLKAKGIPDFVQKDLGYEAGTQKE